MPQPALHPDEPFPPPASRPAPHGEARLPRDLQRDLLAAIANDELALHYQPRATLLDGIPTGAEAVVRWPHRRRGLVSPNMFQTLADHAGVAAALGGWTLRHACAEAVGWPQGSIAVAVSARQLLDQALAGQIAEALEISLLPPERLALALPESALADTGIDELLTLSALRDLGVGLVLDDFGAAIGSLTQLRRLPLTALKLASPLVRNLPADREDAAIVRAVTTTAHALGLTVIADGVETERQRAFLTACGCDEGQGALFGLPQRGGTLRRAR
ncbi:EAL domain-containing protein [Limobrevibacterium gyesilva]|nr:EAL domain-containing protein [Limobrevibacterium gyesilva]